MKKRKIKVILVAIFLIFIGLVLSWPDGKMRLIVCDVGQGDGAILVKGNWQMLIDSGADNGRMGRCLERYLPVWDKKIEVAVISHWDSDHAGALQSILKSFKVERLIESTASGQNIEANIDTIVAKAGDRLRWGELKMEVVYPRDNREGVDNDVSLAMVLDYQGKRWLFTGDMPREAEGKVLGWWNKKIDVLKVSHHGSKTATSEEWLYKLQPELAIISVGANNFGHPSEEVIKRLEAAGSRILRTDQEGDMVFLWE